VCAAACAAAVLLLLPAGAGAKNASACAGAYTAATQMTPQGAQPAMLCLINQWRRQHGLRKVHVVSTLEDASTSYALDMVTNCFFNHMDPDGQDLASRLAQSGFVSKAGTGVGEDLAWGMGNDARPADIFHTWQTSAPHRRNLLDPAYDSVGIGVQTGVPVANAAAKAQKVGGATYVVDFGTRARG
jgi:uncharacterized protein YkwD